MSKKKHAVMQKERESFVYGNPSEGVRGCIANGISEATANHIYDEMIDFASYAFNKSHAAAYAVVSYQTAWLKCYHPAEFMSALMTSVMDNTAKLSEYIIQVRAMGISLMPPDINMGDYGFTATDEHTIIYGLTAIKGVGRAAVEDIVRERTAGGGYRDLEDFISRMPESVNKKAIEGFIKAGAFDSLPGSRKQKLFIMQELLDELSSKKRNDIAGQLSLFDIAGEKDKDSFKRRLPEVGEFSREELLAYEKEATGMYLSGHPIEEYLSTFEKIVTAWSKDYRPDEISGSCALGDGDEAVSGGIITEIKLKITKNQKQMAFMKLEDIYGQYNVIVFPDTFERYRYKLREDGKVYLHGRISIDRDESATLIADTVTGFNEIRRELWVAFKDKADYNMHAGELEELCFSETGTSEVVVFLRQEKAIKRLGGELKVRTDAETLERFKGLYGEENVRLRDIGL